ncbi:hypothetical protein J2Z21_006800 [Streptomyces griseochromogenes]|nr:hypothetical protein [Streptomyces griseochromogenes]
MFAHAGWHREWSVPLAGRMQAARSNLAFVNEDLHSLDEGDHGRYRVEHMSDRGGQWASGRF